MKIFDLKCVGILLFVLGFNTLWGQNKVPHPNAVQIATNHLVAQQKAWQLSEEDVRHFAVQDHYSTADNGVTHVFLIQQHAGIELFNGIVNVNVLPNGEVLYAGNRFMANFAQAVNTTTPQISAEEAVRKACQQLNIEVPSRLTLKESRSKTDMTFDKGSFVLSDVNVKLRYQKMSDREARLAWDLNLDQPDGHDHWSVRVDALTGQIISKDSWTVHCQFDHGAFSHNDACTTEGVANAVKVVETPSALDMLVGDGTYRAFAFPAESPAHGGRQLLVSPADSVASPFGWHDTNGQVGNEFTITRGNNVHAYLDWNNTNTSAGNEPNGGATMVFDYPFNGNLEPDSNANAAVTNLFYVNNAIHDVLVRYGFDEAAGNFQTRNYSSAPGGNDAVIAQAQDGYKLTTPNTDNANFSTPNDGSSGRMQMYVWSRPGGNKLLHITAPNNLIGDISTGTAQFGATIGATPVTGEVVVVNDGSSAPTLGCNAIQTNLTGKIALIDRGTCNFSAKVYNAQLKGAVAAIICNFDETIINMASGTNGAQVTIPSVFVKASDCQRIRVAAGNGLTASLYAPAGSLTGPNYLDGDFDNGIIIHEYTHGISNRLTGGRLNSSCLNNAEQAGEGWSDFIAIALTTRPGDRGNTPRGVGTYVMRQSNDGQGIRRYPYSTDMSVSPLTYEDIILNPAVHSIGEMWVTALWDMYWALVDEYGWDANLYNLNSGNGKALKLVIDGMKLQPCNPGFLDGRDAILRADVANFGGANQCLIWKAFARRGMGYNAKQGLSTSTSDNEENFDINPLCIKTLKLEKTATETIRPGEPIVYTIKAINHKGATATNVVVTDEIPANTTYVAGSASRAATVAGNVITFNLGTMNHMDTITFQYTVNSDPTKRSVAQFNDNLELNDSKWDYDATLNTNIWERSNVFANSGSWAMAVTSATSGSCDQSLKPLDALTIQGTQPVLRFFHKFDTEPGFDVGILQVSTDNVNWNSIPEDKIFKNGYKGRIFYSTFALPNQRGYWGKSNTFIPTYVDMSDYRGQNIRFRFRFGADSTLASTGWFVDDVTVMDMYNYNGRARLTSTQGDTASAVVASRGTIVEPTVFTSSKDLKEELQVKIFPNPTSSFLNINILGAESSEADVHITGVDGRTVWQQKVTLSGATEALIPVDATQFASGMYFVKVQTKAKVVIEKVIKQ